MMKKAFLIILSVMCLYFVLCSCSCNQNNSTVGESSHNHSNETDGSANTNTGTSSSTPTPPSNKDEGNGDITAPETKCELSDKGHYWKDVSINKNTSAAGTIAVSGKCHLCGDSLYKVSTSLVEYNEWKNALSQERLSSFTAVIGDEYTDYSESGSISWRIKEGTYTSDYYVNFDTKNSIEYAKNFQGFALQYYDFKYDSISKTYVYWINENSFVELGFADGDLIYHATVTKKGDREEKTATLYLNHQRITVEAPDFIIEKFENAVSLEALKASSLSASNAESIYNELKSFSFDLKFEASLLENDGLSVYFYLNSPKTDPIYGDTYSTASIIIKEGKATSISFGNTTFDLTYN
ncbi:MAG: hypothetical protein J6B45_04345 [Clostridia bacterium]|nr:hypothetical protein [Clostridia bacterium]